MQNCEGITQNGKQILLLVVDKIILMGHAVLPDRFSAWFNLLLHS
jgi:hypothetical protein